LYRSFELIPTYEELLEENRALKAQVAELLARIAELERRLGTNSRNSSKPPSSDPPWTPPRRRKRAGRKRGGQRGHKGTTRSLLPPDQVDEIVEVKPEKCRRCGRKLPGDDPAPRRHQVADMPEVKPTVTEYRRHTLSCAGCGARTTAELPSGAPRGAFGPRAQAIVGVSSGVYHLSKRTTEAMMGDFFGLDMSLGSVSACEQAVSDSLCEPVAEAKGYVEAAPVKHSDETGWREGKKRAWLWSAVTSAVTVFLVHASRGGKAARELLGSFSGILVSDRWNGYNGWKTRRRQLCWAHLIRDFTAFAEASGPAGRIGEELLDQTKRMFQWWHRVRDGTLKRSSFREYMRPVRRRVEDLLRDGASCGAGKMSRSCEKMLKLAPALWTFVRVEGVEPTNNAAERAIRPGVLWRKGSFGTDSARGSRFVERIMTVAATCRQQGRNVLDYVTRACEAALRCEPAPSLLPEPEASTPSVAA